VASPIVVKCVYHNQYYLSRLTIKVKVHKTFLQSKNHNYGFCKIINIFFHSFNYQNMKNKLLKLADSLLSKEEMKSLKGGDYPPTGGGGGGGGGYGHYAYCYHGYSGNSMNIAVPNCTNLTWAQEYCAMAIGGLVLSCY
jgi:natural product precursor